MHIILKNTLKLIRFIVIASIPFHTSAHKNYLIHHETIHTPFLMEFENDIFPLPYYFSKTEKNKTKQINNKIFVTLSVKQIEHNVSATIKFTNKDKIDHYIHKRLLPINPDVNNPYFFSPLCQDAFLIYMDEIRLKFLPRATNICEYIDDDDNDELYIDRNDSNNIISEWVELPSGKTISFNVMINNAYYFEPGSHWYKIVSLKYRIADSKWFSQRSINKLLFFIINFRYQPCHKYNSPYNLQKLTSICKNYYYEEENNITKFIHKYFPNGGLNKNHIDITSNEIHVKINGDNVKQYQKTKVELLKKRYKDDWENYLF